MRDRTHVKQKQQLDSHKKTKNAKTNERLWFTNVWCVKKSRLHQGKNERTEIKHAAPPFSAV